jgi:thiamine transporter ThiT
VTRGITATTDSGLALGAGTYLTVQAAYLVQPAQFDYLDVFVTARLCGCFEMRLKYRAVQREVWLEFALAPAGPITFPQEASAP